MPRKHHGHYDDMMAVYCGSWTKSPDTGLWYSWREKLPIPKNNSIDSGIFDIKVRLDEFGTFEELKQEIIDNSEEIEKEQFGLCIELMFKVGEKEYRVVLDALTEWPYLLRFVQEIKDDKHARYNICELTNSDLHIWWLGNDKYRFVVQNSFQESMYGDYDICITKCPQERIVAPWAFAIDIEISKKSLLKAFDKAVEDIRKIMTDLFAPNECPVFSKKIQEPS